MLTIFRETVCLLIQCQKKSAESLKVKWQKRKSRKIEKLKLDSRKQICIVSDKTEGRQSENMREI